MSKQILVVEDDSCLSSAIRRAVRHCNRHTSIEWVSTAEAAAEWLEQSDRNHPPDLIVSDIGLAGMKDGIEFWKKCQRVLPKTPFLMISGLPVPDFFARMQGERAPRFLPKPFSVEEFESFVAEFVKESL